MTDTIDLPFADDSTLRITLRGGDAWPNHVHLQLSGATNLDLGNLYVKHYADNLRAWVSRDTPTEPTVRLNNIETVWIANLSPHKHVLYGSVALADEHLIIVDALIAPPQVVAQLRLDEQCKRAWGVHFDNVNV